MRGSKPYYTNNSKAVFIKCVPLFDQCKSTSLKMTTCDFRENYRSELFLKEQKFISWPNVSRYVRWTTKGNGKKNASTVKSVITFPFNHTAAGQKHLKNLQEELFNVSCYLYVNLKAMYSMCPTRLEVRLTNGRNWSRGKHIQYLKCVFSWTEKQTYL